MRHPPSPATVISIVALTVALGGVGYAAIPDNEGAIHACYVERYTKTTPVFRVIDPDNGGRCRNHEKELSFNQHGPTGATGSSGPTGATGVPGPQGTPGGGPLSGGDVIHYAERVPVDTTAALVHVPGFLTYTVRCEDSPQPNALRITLRLENNSTATLNHVETYAGHAPVPPGSATQQTFDLPQNPGYSWVLSPNHTEYVASDAGQTLTQHAAVSAYPDIAAPTACDVSVQAIAG